MRGQFIVGAESSFLLDQEMFAGFDPFVLRNDQLMASLYQSSDRAIGCLIGETYLGRHLVQGGYASM